jgi:hypothetical protein
LTTESHPPSKTGSLLELLGRERRRTTLEYVFVIVLSVATLASAWCGYQLQQWNGAQSDARAEADELSLQAAEHGLAGIQLRTQDGLFVLEYWRALRTGDMKSGELVLSHARPELRRAIEASVAAGILKNPAELGPLQRPEYVLAEELEARRLREEAATKKDAAATAARTAGGYVVVTLMFATVLFFGGIAGTFTQPRVRTVLAVVSILVTLCTLVMLWRLRVFWE